jgi:phosphopantothenoylcysteine decarboxylase/phosphopantothenate--cysteine ligase
VHTALFGAGPGERHVDLARRAQRLLIAPATADTLARLGAGRANDLLTATALCFAGPVAVAPAMHPTMWGHAATQRNRDLLLARGVHFLGPGHGQVASGDVGLGRLLEPEQLVELLLDGPVRDLHERAIVISAGPTQEDLDPVRFISNRSTGKMGFALARCAAQRGAKVTLVAGPVALETPLGVQRVDVRSALEMLCALQQRLEQPSDALIMTAAVGDFRPAEVSTSKLKRAGPVTLPLVENPDLIATLGQQFSDLPLIRIAFALETGSDDEILARAEGKRLRKRVHAVVANRADEALGTDDNRAHLVTQDGVRSFGRLSKEQLAHSILDWLRARWQEPSA